MELQTHIGTDEVGTGDFFGPIVVAAALVETRAIKELLALGIKDSKRMNDKIILSLGTKLCDLVKHQVLILTPRVFNQEMQKYHNIKIILAKLHNLALRKLLHREKLSAFKQAIIIDQFVSAEHYFKYLEDEKQVVTPVIFETKAEDKYLAVALASCLARYYFLLEMKRIGQKYHTAIPLGAGNIVDTFASELLSKIGVMALNDIVKMTFKNYQRVITKPIIAEESF
ncbi:MAG: ribonuclease HIII [Erysipelotrichaceae bacterium]|jgi:ribonuclease HIII|nr:ribonuclease HIII [Erysipelotrichaceae bacterium]